MILRQMFKGVFGNLFIFLFGVLFVIVLSVVSSTILSHFFPTFLDQPLPVDKSTIDWYQVIPNNNQRLILGLLLLGIMTLGSMILWSRIRALAAGFLVGVLLMALYDFGYWVLILIWEL